MHPFRTSRVLSATPEQVFAALSDPARLARWWGPKGFTNSFQSCDFKEGGRWLFTMHGPDGTDYPNESRFAEIESPSRLVIDHISDPKFRLTIILAAVPEGTRVSWLQEFENPQFAKAVEHIIVPSNEQNLDRLSEEVVAKDAS
jgi:uncharacterized protein YndB with AHSA1/START domain